MKVCDVVKNSVWFDPRVRKQLYAYVENNIDVVALGNYDKRYNSDEVEKLPCKVTLVKKKEKYSKISIIDKIIRELNVNRLMYKELIKEKPDVIHANDLNALIPAYKASKKLKCKVIYDSHEIFIENMGIANNKIIKFVWSWLEKRIIKKVDLVVSVSHAAAEYLRDYYNIPKPLVVTNCISQSMQVKNDVSKNFPKEILNHGQFYAGRGYDTLVEVAPMMEKHNDLKIVLRGFGKMEEELRKRASEQGVKNLEFAPPVHTKDLVKYASSAWVGVAITECILINFKLSVSNKLFEYAAAGLPVIMSDIPEHRYLNEKYNFGIILKDNSPEELCRAIEELYCDEDLYNKLSQNALILSDEINWENEFGKLISELNKMVVK